LTPRQALIEIKSIVELHALSKHAGEQMEEQDEPASSWFSHSDDAYQDGVQDGYIELAQGIMSIIEKFENDAATAGE
jgi:hypothetical protein